MTPVWNPELWDKVGVVTLLGFVVAVHAVGYIRGWIIPGRHHREIVDGKDAAITDLRERAVIDAETIKVQAQTISTRDAMEDTATKLLQAFRDAAGSSR
ncbi:hypothetical protein [Mycolicibacterium conceptionense]|uniref:hypothetical protein n=1 Tax=Mycolicibacterium conceptionense TaxID=451644 RepID=UPI0007EE0F49|nr:hypothetical protein [Mycolicibacterium conceptionense]OBJ92680.1 hypothetical protein A5639_07740 [Mycolicibacterium conceptionense]